MNICSRDGDTPLLTAVKDRRDSVLRALIRADQLSNNAINSPNKETAHTSLTHVTARYNNIRSLSTKSLASVKTTYSLNSTGNGCWLRNADNTVLIDRRNVLGQVVRTFSTVSVNLSKQNRKKPSITRRKASSGYYLRVYQHNLLLPTTPLRNNGSSNTHPGLTLDESNSGPLSASRERPHPFGIVSKLTKSSASPMVMESTQVTTDDAHSRAKHKSAWIGSKKADCCQRCNSVGNPAGTYFSN